MNTTYFSAAFPGAHIDTVNAVIRGVSVITSGLIARGHDLEVDDITLEQMQKCADAKGQVPVKVDHKSGAAAVCGFLTNFRREENKLKADWFLLESHPQKAQILEVAQRMPRGVGLSASFVSPDKPERTKSGKAAARCEELISVDYVTLPAANPDGMFAAKVENRDLTPQLLTGTERVKRALGGAGRGILHGGVAGTVVRTWALRQKQLPVRVANTLPASGAAAGALVGAASQWRVDRERLNEQQRAREKNFSRGPVARHGTVDTEKLADKITAHVARALLTLAKRDQPGRTLVRMEAGELAGLAGCSVAELHSLIAEGVIEPKHQSADGMLTCSTAALAALRAAILDDLVERVIEASAGSDEEVETAVARALEQHVGAFDRTTSFSAKLDQMMGGLTRKHSAPMPDACRRPAIVDGNFKRGVYADPQGISHAVAQASSANASSAKKRVMIGRLAKRASSRGLPVR